MEYFRGTTIVKMILLSYLKIKMDWINYISDLSQDKRLTVWHLAMITALLQLAVEQKSEKKIRVSRSLLMKKSLINTIAHSTNISNNFKFHILSPILIKF